MTCTTFESGLSDHQKLATTLLRKTISKGNSEKTFNRDYKRFDWKKFETDLKCELDLEINLNLSTFHAIFLGGGLFVS